LADFQPNDIQWITSYAYATRRAESIPAVKEILLNAETKFPKEAIIKYNLACYCCQLGEIENAKNHLEKAFEIDSTWRLQALDDEDLRPYGIRFNRAVVRADGKLTAFLELESATRAVGAIVLDEQVRF